MSCNSNFSCRETYSSYGSYLRSRGYDKEICNLVFGIETGKIPIGPIIPGNCGTNAPTTINNSVIINPCPTVPFTGILTVNGGALGSLPDSNTDPASHFLKTSEKYGIQSTHGIRSVGPIVQTTDCKHSNYFAAKSHIFDGGGDCSTNVIIRGDLQVDGSTVLLTNEIAETLTLVTQPLNQELGSLNIFRSPLALGNTMVIYNDTSNVVQNSPWEQTLHYAIDGNGGGGSVSDISRNVGLTNQPGHVRSLRGTTVMNPPVPGVSIIPYNTDISGSSIALDVYGDIIVNPGNNNASGNIDLSSGSINFYNNNTKNVFISSTGDASFNGHVTVNDLSVVNMATIGLNTTIIDTLSVETEFIKSKAGTDLRIRGGPLGAQDVIFNQIGNSKVVMNDLSVNQHASIYDLSVNNIDIVGTFVIDDLSVNQHASIYDLSVSDLIQVGSDSINKTIIGQGLTQTVLSDCSFLLCAISGKFFGDCSVNDQLQVGQLMITPKIESQGTDLTIQGGSVGAQNVIFNQIGNSKVVMNDLSVNTYASIYDLSVSDLIQVGTGTIISANSIETNILNSFINNDLTIQGGSAGTQDVIFNQNGNSKVVMNDLSVNTYASIYDLSVTNFMTIGTSTTTIDTNSINATSGYFNDISVNDLSVNTLEIANQLVLQDLSVNTHASIYDLSVTNFMTIGTSTTTIDTNSINAVSGYFNDISVNDLSVNTLEIANQLVLQDLSVNTHASIYDLSVNNFAYINDLSVNALNTGDVSANNLYLKENLTLNGNITGTSGDLLISTLTGGDLRMIAGTLAGQFTDGDIIFERQNAKTTNKFGSTTRTLTNFGETYSIIDMSLNSPIISIPANNIVDISSVIYSNIDNSANIFPNSTGTFEVDFNGLQFNKSIVEIYYTMKIEKSGGSAADAVTVELKESSGLSPSIIDIGTRSISKNLGSLLNTTYGPITLYFDTGSSDSQYLTKTFNLNIISHNGPTNVEEGRLTIKQKSIV